MQVVLLEGHKLERNASTKRKVDDLGSIFDQMAIGLPAPDMKDIEDKIVKMNIHTDVTAQNGVEPERTTKRQRLSDEIEAPKQEVVNNDDKSFISRLGRSSSEPDFSSRISAQIRERSKSF